MLTSYLMREKNNLIFGFVIFFLLGIFSPVFAFNDGDTEKIKIGYYENEKFQEGASEGAFKSGYGYEYLQKISSINGWKYEYIYGSWSDLYNLLAKGEIDLLAGLGYSKNRLDFINYPDYPMGYESYYLYVRDNDYSITRDPKSLNDKKIGCIHGLMEKAIKEWVDKNQIKAEIVLFDDVSDRDNALLEGTVDAFIGEGASVSAKENLIPLLKIKNVDMYLCVSKNRSDLLVELNNALAELDNKEPYYVYELSKKHFNNTAITSHITEVEEKWLQSHNYTIVVGYLENFLPYCATDINGNVTGILVDVLNNGFANLKQSKHIELKFKAYNSTQEMITAINKHEIEMMFPLSNDLNYLEENNLFSSIDVISSAMNIVYKNNLTKAESGKIAINKNNQVQYNYVAKYFPDNPKIYCNSADECLSAVVKGIADATILSGLRASTLLKKSDYSDLSYVELPHNTVKTFGVNTSHKGILPLVNQALNTLEDNVAVSYINKYIEQSLDYSFTEFLKKNILLLSSVIFLILSCIIVLISINRVKHKKQQLYYEFAYKDGLTKMYNRRAYEKEISKYSTSIPDNLICVSMDLTGLKNANDTFGHLAGDELIRESGRLLTIYFGEFGKIFRTGGDEFYAILFTTVKKFEDKKLQFQKQCEKWKGKYSNQLNIAMGYSTPKDTNHNDIIELEKKADKRMYTEKSNWYKSRGVDRRGSKIAYETVCNLYTKILKINITNDTFSIVNIANNEKSENKGYSNKISEWLLNFGKLGNVHPDDLDNYLKNTDINYLRDYFKKGNSSIGITYRRNYDGEYYRVFMEIIIADDYEDNNQSLFLCVKKINDI